MKILAAALGLLLASVTSAAAQTVAPAGGAPIVLPAAPAGGNAASRALFDAMLAIGRAQLTNPAAAQAATYEYYRAAQRYNAGDAVGAERSARSAAAQAALPAPNPLVTPIAAMTPAPPPAGVSPLARVGPNAPAIDAEAFLALARGTLAACAARRDPNLAAAQAQQLDAERAFAAGNYERTRLAARAAIERCARPAQP